VHQLNGKDVPSSTLVRPSVDIGVAGVASTRDALSGTTSTSSAPSKLSFVKAVQSFGVSDSSLKGAPLPPAGPVSQSASARSSSALAPALAQGTTAAVAATAAPLHFVDETTSKPSSQPAPAGVSSGTAIAPGSSRGPVPPPSSSSRRIDSNAGESLLPAVSRALAAAASLSVPSALALAAAATSGPGSTSRSSHSASQKSGDSLILVPSYLR